MPDGTAVSPQDVVAGIVAGVPRSLELQNFQAEARRHDAEAEAAIEELRRLEALPESAARDESIRKTRIARLAALDAASKARVALRPLAQIFYGHLVEALQPMLDEDAEQIAAELDGTAARIKPAVDRYNAVADAINKTGIAGKFPLSLSLPDGFLRLVASLTRLTEARTKAAAAQRRSIFRRWP